MNNNIKLTLALLLGFFTACSAPEMEEEMIRCLDSYTYEVDVYYLRDGRTDQREYRESKTVGPFNPSYDINDYILNEYHNTTNIAIQYLITNINKDTTCI